MSRVEGGLEELELVAAREDWALAIIEAEGFRHIASAGCIGWTIINGGRVTCFRCGWRESARYDDRGLPESARFVFAALGTIGLAIEWAFVVNHADPAQLEAAFAVAEDPA